jgi:hypothetical protein
MATTSTAGSSVQANAGFGGSGVAQTPEQLASNFQTTQASGAPVTNLNGGSIAGSPDPTAPPVNQTQDAAAINGQISGNTQGVIFPQAPAAPTNGPAVNNATTSPNIPSAADIISQGTQSTPAEQTNTTLLQKVAALIGGKKSQQGLTNSAEQAAGVPQLNQTLTSLNDQLTALNNQATDLQNQASPGGSIQNQEQQNVLGRGVTDAGLQPLAAGDLRKNQIQQSAIASQALTLKSLVYAAQNSYSNAKTAADNAAEAAFEDQNNQVAYQQALIAANAPQMTKEEKAQADLVTANLQDRQTQITNGIADAKTGQGLIATALANNPDDPNVAYAVQQAAKLDKTDPNYLTQVLGLVGQYQKDPIAVATAVANLQKARADAVTATNTADASSGNTTVPVQNGDGSTTNVPANVAPYYNTSHSGVGYVDASTLQGTAAQKTAIVNQAQAAGLKVITNKDQAVDLFNIGDANNKLNTVMSTLSSIDQPGAVQRDTYGLLGSTAASYLQTDSQKAAAGALSSIGTDILKALQGVQGSRMSQAAVANITKELPTIYDTDAVVQTKVANLQKLLNDREDALLGSSGTNTTGNTTLMVGPDGKQYNVPNTKVADFTKAGGKLAQ